MYDCITVTKEIIFFLLMMSTLTSSRLEPDQAFTLPPSFSKFNTDINSPDIQIVVMTTQQYHFVPLGSYFQFSLNSFQFRFDSAFLSHLTVSYNINRQTSPSTHNLIVLNSAEDDSAYKLNCYTRAVNQGLTQLMGNCSFNPEPNPSGLCASSILNESRTAFQNKNFFSNCTDLNVPFNITVSSQEEHSALNGTLLFMIDNSGLFPSVSDPSVKVDIILSIAVIANVNDADKAKLFLICSLTGVVILIMIIFAAALNCKIRRLDKDIKDVKSYKKE